MQGVKQNDGASRKMRIGTKKEDNILFLSAIVVILHWIKDVETSEKTSMI